MRAIAGSVLLIAVSSAGFVTGAPAIASAQAPPPATSAEVMSTAIQEAMKKAVQDLKPGVTVNDRIISLQDMGKYNVAVAVVARPGGAFTNSLSHEKITEIYYVLKGSGTQVTGTMVDGTRGATVSKTIGPGLSSNSPIQNAKSRKLGPGDIQVIPPGVAHGFTSIDPGGIEYLVFRVDPEHFLAMP
jgi:mannose-6-phosphate isomerase-like protein (cupin superfamily)